MKATETKPQPRRNRAAPTKPQMSKTTFREVRIDQIHESKTNPRTIFNKERMTELIASVAAHGVIEPLILWTRPAIGINLDRLEIIAGARRYRAAVKAGLTTLPAMVHELSEREALEIQLIENVEREDLHPMEEARGFRAILKLDGYTAEILAEKIGHPVEYVYKRLQLTKLHPALEADFRADKLTISHAARLCRLAPASQTEIVRQKILYIKRSEYIGKQWFHDVGTISIPQLDAWIRQNILLDLQTAPWKKDDAELVPTAGACSTCPKRSSANAVLFDDLPKHELCLDRVCYNQKAKAILVQIETAAKAAGGKVTRIVKRYTYAGEEKTLGAIGTSQFREAKQKNCDRTHTGIIVDGDGFGTTLQICTDQKCSIHWRTSGYGSGGPKRTFAELWAERKKGLETKIRQQTHRQIFTAILAKPMKWTVPEPILRALAVKLSETDQSEETISLIGIPFVKKKGAYLNYSRLADEHISKEKASELPRLVIGFALAGAIKEYSSDFDGDFKRMLAVAAATGVNVKTIQNTIAASLEADHKARYAKALAKNKAEATKAAPAKAKPARKK